MCILLLPFIRDRGGDGKVLLYQSSIERYPFEHQSVSTLVVVVVVETEL